MIIYPFACIPEAWLIDDYSIRLGLIISAACNIIGSGLKLLVNKDNSLASCYIGQFIAGLFQPALLNSPGKIAANWFREDIRTVICTICCLPINIGALVGFLWNLIFIKEKANEEDAKKAEFNDKHLTILYLYLYLMLYFLPLFFYI
jgi:sugar phosphate permease